MPWNDGLEGPALEIARTDRNPVRVDAGPGTGKTFALMRRVWRLITAAGADPRRLFVGTFTRTAAADLKKSFSDLGIPGVDNIRAGTIHAYCFGLLAKHEVFEWTQRTPRPLLAFEERFLVEDIGRDFGTVSQREDRLEAFAAAWARRQSEEPGWPADPIDQRCHQASISWLQFHEAMLIGELIAITNSYLRANPAPVFDHVLVDEYQDLNRAEQAVLDLLAVRGSKVVVGDEDQSIYQFKCANPEGMRDFGLRHPGTYDIPLTECRRCPRLVVEMANELVARNQNRRPRRLVPRPGNPEGEVSVVRWRSAAQEAQGLAQYIAGKINAGEVAPGRVLVLAPRRYFGYAIRDELRALDIPAHSFFTEEELEGTPKDLERCRSQKAFTLLNLLASPRDRVSLRCWLGFGSPSLNRGAWSRLRTYCEDRGQHPRDVFQAIAQGQLTIPRGVADFIARFRELERLTNQFQALRGQELIEALFPSDEDWAVNLNAMAILHAPPDCTAEELRDALRSAITQPELPTDVDYVRVMSLHKSKGLTADLVVIAGCIQGAVPFVKDGLSNVERAAAYEEQRRLFFVAVTRTTQTLVISSAESIPRADAYRMRIPVRGGHPVLARTIASTFIDELGQQLPPTQRGEELLR